MDKDSLELVSVIPDGEQPRKLAVLGLPWETTEETLKVYFSQFGALEGAEVMKDRYTGKSRGFGFVTFTDAGSATRALGVEHTIDGRRCEAKIALPKGEPSPPRTTRIFVARIPPSVTEAQFRQYFEGFGKLQDAYMPKDHSKQGYRGIGFVTFASPDSVEKVMAVKHWMNGHEIAIDRATPKEEPTALKNIFARLPVAGGPNQRRSFDNGSGIIGPGLGMMNNNLIGPGAIDATFGNLRSLSEERDLGVSGMMGGSGGGHRSHHADVMDSINSSGLANGASLMGGGSGLGAGMNPALRATSQALGLNLGLGLNGAAAQSATAAAAAAATTAALQTLAKNATLSENVNGVNAHMSALSGGLNGMGGLNGLSDLTAATSLLSNGLATKAAAAAAAGHGGLSGISGQTMLQDLNTLGAAAAVQQMMQAAASASAASAGRRSLDSTLKRMENPAIANARAGPRIFIGKLTKDTSEADVKDYFMRFGYVMDVYLPKAKDNKAEHRGFGFVTFETDAAIQRVVSHGQHRLKGSTIAIDIAMPKVEDGEMNLDGTGLDAAGAGAGLSGFGALPNMLVQRM